MPKSTPVPAKPAIQSDEQAGQEAQEYVEAKAALDRIDIAKKAAVDAINQQFALLSKPYKVICDERFPRVQAWAEANREGRSTIKFPNGRVFRWRSASKARLIVNGTIEVIGRSLLQRPDWEKFLDLKLKKSNLTSHPEVVEETEGLDMERGVYVSIG
ncbi:hypothetical protein KW792_00285 [Candidatus Saccharibacteria bacterium]|nr:hypothetical protein [Candidatus Saccharibacteria bacterium]